MHFAVSLALFENTQEALYADCAVSSSITDAIDLENSIKKVALK